MIIITDQEGKSVIRQLCDIALKDGGIGNLNQVNLILRSVESLPVSDVEEKSQPKSSKEKDEAEDSAVVEKKEELPKEEPKKEVIGDEEPLKPEVIKEVKEDTEVEVS